MANLFFYCKRANTGRSRLVAAPLKFQAKTIFYVFLCGNHRAQKTIFKYINNGKLKNIVEIEIRNDSKNHYRQVRFNMYSKDALSLLLSKTKDSSGQKINKSDNAILYSLEN